MKTNKILFLDLDGVMVTGKQDYEKKLHPKYNINYFDKSCVKVLNTILEDSDIKIVISSDWKCHFNLSQLNEIFKDNGINAEVLDVTPNLWGIEYFNLNELEVCRANEILAYVKLNNIETYVAVDDLNLSKHIDNFVICKRYSEGIKQTGIKGKILKFLK